LHLLGGCAHNYVVAFAPACFLWATHLPFGLVSCELILLTKALVEEATITNSIQLRLISPVAGMVKNITVVVYSDPDQPFYYPGSYVKGAVTVSTDTPKDYDSIVVKLYGRANVHWTESDNSGGHHSSRTYSNIASKGTFCGPK
jgi:hypothetical protein